MKRIFSCSPAPKIPAVKWNKSEKKIWSAVDQGDVDKLRSALLKGAVNPTKLDTEGTSSFHLAASRGATDCLDLMLMHGVDINARNFEGATALHMAVKNSQLDCVRSLLKYNVPVKETDFHGRTALHFAAISGCVSSAELLCDHGALTDPLDRESQTPLMIAAWLGRPEICRLLIERGAAINATDSKHRTALILACESDCPEVAEVLLSAGVDVSVTDISGCDARHYGQQSKSERLHSLLQADGVSIASEPGHTGRNHWQDPTELPGMSTPLSSPAVSLASLHRKPAMEQELSAISSKSDEEKEEVSKLHQDLARKISECNTLAEEYEGMKRQVNRRLRIFIQPMKEPKSIQDDDHRGMDLVELDLLVEILGQQLQALREDLERTKNENRILQEQVKRKSWERGAARTEMEGSRAKTDGDIERLREELDNLAEEKSLAERRFTELEGHLDNMRAVMSQYQTRKCSQSKQIDELEVQASDLASHNVQLATLVKNLQEELKNRKDKDLDVAPLKGLDDAHGKVETIPGQLVELAGQCSALRKEKEDLAEHKEGLEKELRILRGRIQTEFVPLEIHDETTVSWKKVILYLKETIRETEHKFVDLQMEVEQLQGENRRLRERSHQVELGHVPLAKHEEEKTRLQEAVTGLQKELSEAKRKLIGNSEGWLEAGNVKMKENLDEARSEISSFRIQEGAIISLKSTISDPQSELGEKQQELEPDRETDPRAGANQNRDCILELDNVQASPSNTVEELEREVWEERVQKDTAEKDAARLEEENKNLKNDLDALQHQLRVEFVPESRYKELKGSVEELKRHISDLTAGLHEAKQEANALRRKSEAEWTEIRSFRQSLLRASPLEEDKAPPETSVVDIISGLHRQVKNLKEKCDAVEKDKEILEKEHAQQRLDFTTMQKQYIPTQEHEDLKGSMRREAMEKITLQDALLKAQEEMEGLREDLAKQESNLERMEGLEMERQRLREQIESQEEEAEEHKLEVTRLQRELGCKASEVAALQDREIYVLKEQEETKASLEALAQDLGEDLKNMSTACEDSRQAVLDLKERHAAERQMGEENLAVAAKQLETLQLQYDKLEQTLGDLQEEVTRYSESCFEKEEQVREMMSDIEKLDHEREKCQRQAECVEQRLKESERHHEQVISIYRAHLLSAAQGVMDEEVYLVLMGIWEMQQGLLCWRKERVVELPRSLKPRELGEGKGNVLAEE